MTSKVGWDPVGGKGTYDPNQFYTSASDRQGHGKEIRTQVPTEVRAEISKIIESNIIPDYQTASDLVRDAIVHRLHTLQSKIRSGELQRVLNLTVLYHDNKRISDQREQFREMLQIIETNCTHYQTAGEHERLREYCEDMLNKAHVVPIEHRSRYIALLEGKIKTIGGF
jgi:hypothetical protein